MIDVSALLLYPDYSIYNVISFCYLSYSNAPLTGIAREA